jgi:methyltransferase (TIGR00027 family)
MQPNQASVSALVAAFARAYHAMYDEPKIFDDFLARKFIRDEEFHFIAQNMAAGIKVFNPEEAHLYPDESSALKWVIQTQIAPTTIARSRYTEDMLENALMLGVKQYVILGAGYDTFPFRNPDLLKKLHVFEVDHPATQEDKIKRIKDLGWEMPPSFTFVPVDFTKDHFKQSLLEAGYNPKEPAFFSWLGVTYYLTREEIIQIFKDIASIALRGSSIVFDYPDPGIFDSTKRTTRVQHMVNMAKTAGEPMKTAYEYRELEADLEKAGLLIYEHISPSEIEERYFSGRDDYYHAFENIHYVLGVVG